jgi:hypothetical protein
MASIVTNVLRMLPLAGLFSPFMMGTWYLASIFVRITRHARHSQRHHFPFLKCHQTPTLTILSILASLSRSTCFKHPLYNIQVTDDRENIATGLPFHETGAMRLSGDLFDIGRGEPRSEIRTNRITRSQVVCEYRQIFQEEQGAFLVLRQATC